MWAVFSMRGEALTLVAAALVLTCIVYSNNHLGVPTDDLLEELTSDAFSKKKTFRGHTLVRFETPLSSHGELLHNLLDDDTDLDLWQEVKGSHAIVRVPPKQMRTINKWSPSPLGLHQIIHSNVQQLIEAEAKPAGNGFFSRYHDFSKLESRWKLLARKYPKVVQLSVIGKTHEGRKISAIHISAPGTPKNAPEIFVQGGQHAREWIAAAATTYVAEALAHGQSHGDKAVTKALKHTIITFVPLLNPDGYQYSRTSDRMWRKNRNYKKGHEGMCVGVDPNRNWNVHWSKTMRDGKVQRDRVNRCSSTFAGPSALSEAEPQAIAKYIASRRGRVKAFLDVHSYSQEVLPPGCNGYPINKKDRDLLKKGSVALTQALSHKGVKYTTGNCAEIMYACSGTAHDWAFNKGIKQSYCVEVRPGEFGSGGFVLPASEIHPTSQELLAGVLGLTAQAVPTKYKFDMKEMKEMPAYQSAETLHM